MESTLKSTRTKVSLGGLNNPREHKKPPRKGSEKHKSSSRQRRDKSIPATQNNPQELKDFLVFALSEHEDAERIRSIKDCKFVLDVAVAAGFVHSTEDTLLHRLEGLLQTIEKWRGNELSSLVELWMLEAIAEEVYSQDEQARNTVPETHKEGPLAETKRANTDSESGVATTHQRVPHEDQVTE